MINRIIILILIMSAFVFANTKESMPPIPTIQKTTDDDENKLYRRKRGGKGNKGRRKGGNGLR